MGGAAGPGQPYEKLVFEALGLLVGQAGEGGLALPSCLEVATHLTRGTWWVGRVTPSPQALTQARRWWPGGGPVLCGQARSALLSRVGRQLGTGQGPGSREVHSGCSAGDLSVRDTCSAEEGTAGSWLPAWGCGVPVASLIWSWGHSSWGGGDPASRSKRCLPVPHGAPLSCAVVPTSTPQMPPQTPLPLLHTAVTSGLVGLPLCSGECCVPTRKPGVLEATGPRSQASWSSPLPPHLASGGPGPRLSLCLPWALAPATWPGSPAQLRASAQCPQPHASPLHSYLHGLIHLFAFKSAINRWNVNGEPSRDSKVTFTLGQQSCLLPRGRLHTPWSTFPACLGLSALRDVPISHSHDSNLGCPLPPPAASGRAEAQACVERLPSP